MAESKLDAYNMYQTLVDFPDQLERGLEIARDVGINGDLDNVLISGMGGSAIPGLLLDDYLGGKIPIIVNRDYTLPPGVNSDTLVFISSYSGNTEETLNVFELAKKRKMRMIGFCSGEELEELCKENSVPYVKYPEEEPGFQPRIALGYAFASMCRVLSNCGLINDRSKDIVRCAQTLRSMSLEREGKSIANRLRGKIPVIYTSERFRSLGYITKIKFNETSKVMAFSNVIPEMNHNEINGYMNSKKQGKFHVIMLKDKDDHPKVIKRMDVSSRIIKSKGGEVTVINLMGDDLLTKMFSVIYLFDWVTYYLALSYKTDPSAVELNDEVKRRVK